MRRIAIIVGIGLVVVAAAWYLTRPQPIAVLTHTVDRGLVEVSVANTRAGTIKACLRARLTPSTGGQVARLHAREGDRVARDQVLLELWNEDLKARVEHAKSEARATDSRVDEVCLNADVARREAGRLRPLRAKGLISEESLDVSETEAQAKQAACRTAHGQREVAEARVAVAEAELERTILRAAFKGVVAEVTGEVGEFVTPSPTGIVTPPAVDLIDYSCVYVSAPIDEVDAPAIRVGLPTRVTLDAFGERIFPGQVRRIAPYVLDIEKQARTVEVEVSFDEPGVVSELLPGYSADIEVITDSREQVIRVPTEAVLEGDRVLVLVDGQLQERNIQTASGSWRWTEVREGLSEGEQVVLSVDREGVVAGAMAAAKQAP